MAGNVVSIVIKGEDQASKTFEAVEHKSKGMSTSLLAVGAAGAVVAGGLAVSVNAAANFEHAVSQVAAVSGATKDELKGLSDTALRLGKETAFGATEAAQAMEILAANGVPVAAIINGAADAAVALAAAGGTTLATAADTASTAMAVWGLQAEDMTDLVNRLAGAANVSRFGVEDMSLAIAAGGGAAAAAGVEVQDFLTTVAAIAPAFSSGADAGTSLKTMFMAMANPSTKAAEALRELGLNTYNAKRLMEDYVAQGLGPATDSMYDMESALRLNAAATHKWDLNTESGLDKMRKWQKEMGYVNTAFYDANGNLKSMAEISGILNEATKDLTEQQRSEALATIFGSDAMRAAGQLMQITEEQFVSMSDTMGNTNAADVAKLRMDNFKGALDGLKGTIETIQIQIGMKFLPVLTTLAQLASDKLPVAFDAVGSAVNGVSGYLEQFISKGDQLQALGVAVGALFAVWAAGAAAAAASTIIAAAPIIALTVGIAALAAGVFLLIKHWDDLKEKYPPLQQATEAVRDVFQEKLIPALRTTRDAIAAIVDFFVANWPTISAIVGPVVDQVGLYLETMWNIIKNVVQLVVALVSGDWSSAWEQVKDIVGTAKDYVIESLNNLKKFIDGLWPLLKEAASNIGSAIANGIKEGIENAWGAVLEKIQELINRIPKKIRELLGISSPSKVMAEQVGAPMAWGIVAGFEQQMPEVLERLIEMVRAAVAAAMSTVLDGGVTQNGGSTPDQPHILQGAVAGFGAYTQAPTAAAPSSKGKTLSSTGSTGRTIADYGEPSGSTLSGTGRTGRIITDYGEPSGSTLSGTGSTGRTPADYGEPASYAHGTPWVPRTGYALLHQGEAVIPAHQNRGGLHVTIQALDARSFEDWLRRGGGDVLLRWASQQRAMV